MTQLDATLRSIDEITNMDVEMQVCLPTRVPCPQSVYLSNPMSAKVPLSDRLTIIVLDTNILLEFLDIIQIFVSEAEQQQLPVLIIIPGAVIHELDACA